MPSSKGSAKRGKPAQAKIVKKELTPEEIEKLSTYNYSNVIPAAKPSVEISKCISFQKFRYSGENRPGKKYQEKEFMTLKLSNLTDKVVRIVIICTDADNRELIHPNGLVGKDCHDGIYDKEYAVTKQFFIIKIPYLRTERIKTKKNEHQKIQQVLSDRASHLPSPYKERCLSQCTDKYTSSRKFDTTKVCLGVIVTVQSHQGTFNGSLHAISHVVRNASEKTSLAILKLSTNTVPAATGGLIDIFTTEDGPAIEPDKYQVHVSQDCEVNGVAPWQSEKHSPSKNEILYKRVITFEVPPYYPNQNNLTSEVQAVLHLDCPQSNQYCYTEFTYVPQGIVVVDEHGHTISGNKRSYPEQQDIKPCPKRLRQEYEEGSRESLMSNLKTKIISRKEIPDVAGNIYIDNSGDRQEEVNHHYIIDHQVSQGEPFPQEHSVLIRHQDPQTGEPSYLLDMDASKANKLRAENQYALQHFSLNQMKEKNSSSHILQSVKAIRGKVSPFQSHSQGVEVVATGYSDAVPPNTTVLIYTTNGGSSEHVAVDSVTGEQMVIERISEENPVVITSSSGQRNEESQRGVEAAGTSHQVAVENGISPEQIIRREVLNECRRPVRQVTSQAGDIYQREPAHSVSEKTVNVSEQSQGIHSSHSASDIHNIRPARKFESDRLSPVPTSSSSIPNIRRMLIPNKNISSASPWEVGTEDNESDMSILQGIFTERKNSPSSYPVAVKKEPADTMSSSHINSSSKTISGYQKYGYIPDKQLHTLEESANQPKSTSNDEEHTSEEGEHTTAARDSGRKAGLDSLDLSNAVADNLTTMNIFEIAKNLGDELPSTIEGEHMETTQQNLGQQET